MRSIGLLLALGLLVLPAVVCCCAGGWQLLAGAPPLVLWLWLAQQAVRAGRAGYGADSDSDEYV